MKTTCQKTDLRSLTQEQLIAFVEGLGQPAFRGKQLLPWVYKPGLPDFDSMTDLAKNFRHLLIEKAEISYFETRLSNKIKITIEIFGEEEAF